VTKQKACQRDFLAACIALQPYLTTKDRDFDRFSVTFHNNSPIPQNIHSHALAREVKHIRQAELSKAIARLPVENFGLPVENSCGSVENPVENFAANLHNSRIY
jgi:hypothetical protein